MGNYRFANEKEVCIAAIEKQLKALEQQGKTTIILGDSRKPSCINNKSLIATMFWQELLRYVNKVLSYNKE